MKNKSTFKTLKSFVIIFALIFTTNTYAYSNTFAGWFNWDWWKDIDWSWIIHKHDRWCGHNGGGHQGGGDSVPLDGGLGILVLGAAAFGVKKLRDNKNDKA